MLRRLLWCLPILLMAGSAFFGWELSDYRQGYRQAVQDAERLQQKYGWMADVGSQVLGDETLAEGLSEITSDAAGDVKSEQWREGYQKALREIIAKRATTTFPTAPTQ